MEIDVIIVLVAVGIVIAALVGIKSGLTTAFLEILAGLIIGNFVAGGMPEALNTLSELGIITLMFMAGLEVDLQFIRNKGRQGITIGLTGFLVTFLVMSAIGLLWFQWDMAMTLLMAIGLSSCSAGMVYAALRKKGELGERRKIILSASMVMEFLGLILLSTLFTSVSWVAVIVVAFIILVRLAWPILQRQFAFLTQDNDIAIKAILAVLLTSSLLASTSGLDVILIVFVLGIFLSRYVEEHKDLKKQIETIGFGFLTPIFFVSVGFDIDLIELLTELPLILLLVALSFALTFIGVYVPARRLVPKRARSIAILLNTPMSVGIVAAAVGRDQGILSQEYYIALIGAVILSSFIGMAFNRYPIQSREKPAG